MILMITQLTSTLFLRENQENGSLIEFWNEIWIGNSPLSHWIPRLALLDLHPHCVILDRFKLHSGSFTTSWARRRPIRPGLESAQLQDLLELVSCIHLDDNKVDSWDFIGADSRSFSVNSMKKLMEYQSLLINDDHPCWNNLIPKKVNILTWRLEKKNICQQELIQTIGESIFIRSDVHFVTKDWNWNDTFSLHCIIAKQVWSFIANWWKRRSDQM